MDQQLPSPTQSSPAHASDSQPDTSQSDASASDASAHIHVQGKIEFDTFLPPPALIERYNSIVPDYGERLLRMTESHAEHQHSIEKRLLDFNFTALQTESSFKHRGQWFAFLICILFGLMGLTAILKGYEWGGAILGTIGLAPIVGYFIVGQHSQSSQSNQIADDSGTDKE